MNKHSRFIVQFAFCFSSLSRCACKHKQQIHTEMIESVHVVDWHEDDCSSGITTKTRKTVYFHVHLKVSTNPAIQVFYKQFEDFRAIEEIVTLLFAEYDMASHRPRFPRVDDQTSWLSMIFQTHASDKRKKESKHWALCRELDWYWQQVISCFGSRHEGFWNSEQVRGFFECTSDRLVNDNILKTNSLSHHMHAPQQSADLFDKQLERLRRLYNLLTRSKQINPEHRTNMQSDYVQLCEQVHKQLQLTPSHPDTPQRWKMMEPFIGFLESIDMPTVVCGKDGKTINNNNSNRLNMESSNDQVKRDKMMVQDKQLELIGESVGRLKELGKEMEKEIGEQHDLAKDISNLVDNSNNRTQKTMSRVQTM